MDKRKRHRGPRHAVPAAPRLYVLESWPSEAALTWHPDLAVMRRAFTDQRTMHLTRRGAGDKPGDRGLKLWALPYPHYMERDLSREVLDPDLIASINGFVHHHTIALNGQHGRLTACYLCLSTTIHVDFDYT